MSRSVCDKGLSQLNEHDMNPRLDAAILFAVIVTWNNRRAPPGRSRSQHIVAGYDERYRKGGDGDAGLEKPDGIYILEDVSKGHRNDITVFSKRHEFDYIKTRIRVSVIDDGSCLRSIPTERLLWKAFGSPSFPPIALELPSKEEICCQETKSTRDPGENILSQSAGSISIDMDH
ncbi:hypothetical protein O181_037228 [Austropuccinia psidii MF-1]|uniref:Uncharacterized protein n=1 Tax=Austropuccinia psidii MF-1 TaxID=1389203 RepID=A0A9Q3H9W7_9BASI|nr:hypothetical protein [Austropuccinia psidii MF-1]